MRYIVWFFILLVINHNARAIEFDGLLNPDTFIDLKGSVAQSSSRPAAAGNLSDADVEKGLKDRILD